MRSLIERGVVALPQVNAVLQSFLPGPHGGGALADALLGRFEPSGRLPISWPTAASSLLYPHWHPTPRSGGRRAVNGVSSRGPAVVAGTPSRSSATARALVASRGPLGTASLALEAEYLPISPHISRPRSGTRTPVFQRQDTDSAVFGRLPLHSRCPQPPRIHAVL